jgi:5-methylcytosine-specific restriction endonuclease McrA
MAMLVQSGDNITHNYPYSMHNQTLHKQTIVATDGRMHSRRIVHDVQLSSGTTLVGYIMLTGKEHIVEKRLSDDCWRVREQSSRYRREESQYRIPDRMRERVMARDNYTCQICGSTAESTIDHIIPVVAGGEASEDNLQVLCRSCNARKSAGRGNKLSVAIDTIAGRRYENVDGGIYTPATDIIIPSVQVHIPKSVQVEVDVKTIEIQGHGLMDIVLGVMLVRKSYIRNPKPKPIKLVTSRQEHNA